MVSIKKYIVPIEGLELLKKQYHTALKFASVELTEDDLEILAVANIPVREDKVLEVVKLADPIDYAQEKSAWIKYYKKNITGRGVKIATLDNGINQTYVPVFSEQNFTAAANYGNHGTMTMSIIYSLAPGTERHSLKWIDGTSGTEGDLLEALNYCLVNDMDIINCSFQFYESVALNSAFDDLAANGTLIFCSAGNSGSLTDLVYPAYHKDCIAVNGVDINGAVHHYNWNIPIGGTHGIHIACGGWNQRIIDGAGATYGNYGTSFSSPFAAAIAACALEEIGLHNKHKLKQYLFNMAQKQPNEAAFGHGIINC